MINIEKIKESLETEDFNSFSSIILEDPKNLNIIIEDNSLLSLAIKQGKQEFVDFLMEHMSTQQINDLGAHPLITALEINSPFIETLIKNPKTNLLKTSKSGHTFLYYASYYNRVEYVDFLLENGVNPHKENNTGESAVIYVISNNNLEIFDKFFQCHDFSSNYSDLYMQIAIRDNAPEIVSKLHPYTKLSDDELYNLAIDFRNPVIIKIIMDNSLSLILGQSQIQKLIGVVTEYRENEIEQTAAAELIDHLFKINIPFNRFIDENNLSIWWAAINNGQEHIIDKLLQTKEPINIVDSDGQTPIFYALFKRKQSIAKKILAKNPKLDVIDKNGNTPLIQAIRFNQPEIVEEILKHKPILIDAVNNAGESALSLAVHQKQMDLVSSLLWAGGNIMANPIKTIEEISVYQIGLSGEFEKGFNTIEERQFNDFISLSKIGLNMNEKNKHGDTYLNHFIKTGHLANFKILLQCNFNPNETDKDGNTPIMLAAQKQTTDYMKGLLYKFRDINLLAKNNKNETIYDILKKTNDYEKVKLIIENDNNIKEEEFKKVLGIITDNNKLPEIIEILKKNNLHIIQSLYKHKKTTP